MRGILKENGVYKNSLKYSQLGHLFQRRYVRLPKKTWRHTNNATLKHIDQFSTKIAQGDLKVQYILYS